MIKTFGECIRDKDYTIVPSQTRMTIDNNGDIIVAFQHFPLVRKYSIDSKLIFETDLTSNPVIAKYAECDNLVFPDRFDRGENCYTSFIYARAVTVDKDNNIYIYFGDKMLIILSKDGDIKELVFFEKDKERIVTFNDVTNIQIINNKLYVPSWGNKILVYSLNKDRETKEKNLEQEWYKETIQVLKEGLKKSRCSVKCGMSSCDCTSKFSFCHCCCAGMQSCVKCNCGIWKSTGAVMQLKIDKDKVFK